MCDKERFPGCGRQFDGGEGEEMCGNEHRHEHCRREKFMRFFEEASVGDKLMFDLRFVGRAMRSGFEANAGQKRILVMLREMGTLTQRELTERLGVRPGSASEILAKLENAGLIARTPNEFDRRTIDVSLTEAGAQAAEESAEMRSRWSGEMFSCLTPEEQETLLSLLEKLRADWEERYPVRRGHHGPHGECGHHGPFGPHGEFGPHGDFGPRGPHGEFCHHGPFGPHGECGPHGEFGPRGQHGEFCHHGPFGPHGEFGHHGDFGPHWAKPGCEHPDEIE